MSPSHPPVRHATVDVDGVEGCRENLSWFPHYQAHLLEHRPPTLIV